MLDGLLAVAICVSLLALMALATVVPWLIGLGWMLHHWFGV